MVKSVKVAGCLAKQRHSNVLEKTLGTSSQHRHPKQQQQQQQQHQQCPYKNQLNGPETTADHRTNQNNESTGFVLNKADLIEEDTFSTFPEEEFRQQQQQYHATNASSTTNPLPFNSIPGPKPSLPFIGTNWIYFPIVGYYQSMKLHEANMDKYKRYGPIMKEEYQRGYPSVTIFDPKDIKEVFMREGTCPSRPVLPYVIRHRQSDPSRYPNVGLANMMGKEWLELRSQLAPLLLSKDLKRRHIGSQNRVSTRLVNYIKNLLPASRYNSNSNSNSNNNNNNNYQEYQQSNGMESSETSDDNDIIGTNINKNNNDSKHLVGGNVYNIQEVFYRFSMESIMNLCINQELGCLNNNNATNDDNKDNYKNSNNNNNDSNINLNTVTSDGELIFQAAMSFFEAQHKLYYGSNLWKYYNTKLYRQLCDSQNAIHHIASKYIDVALDDLKKRKRRSKLVDNYDNNNVIFDNQSLECEEHESLLETLYSTNKFSDLEIKSTIVDFIGGGIYTVANTLTMALYLLASNPSIQEHLYQEISQVFKQEIETGSDINIDLKKLEQLKFLKLCLKESYRLLPTIPGIARILQKDLVLSNYLVPKNTLVFCNFMVTCRLPEYFEDPDTYNPSRWERTGKTKGDLAFCLLPFGHGVRKCIGHNFAELEIYVALAKLVRSFQIRTVGDAKSLELSYKFIVVPERPVHLAFLPRARNSRFLM